MKRVPLILTVAVLGAALSACGKQPAEPAAPVVIAPAPAAPMAGMNMSGAMMAGGTGTVVAIDKAAGTITLDHGPIDAVKWPAMTMAFKAVPTTLLDTVKVGDAVSFELRMAGSSGEITAIRAQ
ncbi:MAG: copper-binding protein [Caulobacter sp.]|nr:copper-binding protein [Caulobacter sp.]